MAEAAWLTDQLPTCGDDFGLRAELMGSPAAAISGWMGLCTSAYLTAGPMAVGAGLDEPYSEDAAAPYGGAVLIGLLAGSAGFLIMLAGQALLWLPVHTRRQRRVRDRAAQVVRRELGDSYDAFLHDLRQAEFAILRPRYRPARAPAPTATDRGRHLPAGEALDVSGGSVCV